MVRLRSLFFTGLGLLAASLLYIVPASAIERAPGIYAVSIIVTMPTILDYVVAPDAAHVAVLRDSEHVLPDRMRAGEALGPIYALSMETDGQSLSRYHLRC